MHLDLGAIAQAQHFIIGEIRLDDGAFVDGDRPVQRRGEAEGNAAFDLCPQPVRIDSHAAIDRRNDTIDFERTVRRDFDFGDVRNDRIEAFDHGDAAAFAFRQRLVPARFLCNVLYDRLVARAILEQRQPISDRIDLCDVSKLIDERLDKETVP